MAQKGVKTSEETKRRISEAHQRRSALGLNKGVNNVWYGKEITDEFRKKMSLIKKGQKHSEETKKKISDAFKGRHFSPRTKFKKGQKRSPESIRKTAAKISGENSCNWLGDKVGYIGLHLWVRRTLGLPMKCEHCNKEFPKGSRSIHWANKSHEYRREAGDWLRLCVSCHKKYDLAYIKNRPNKSV